MHSVNFVSSSVFKGVAAQVQAKQSASFFFFWVKGKGPKYMSIIKAMGWANKSHKLLWWESVTLRWKRYTPIAPSGTRSSKCSITYAIQYLRTQICIHDKRWRPTMHAYWYLIYSIYHISNHQIYIIISYQNVQANMQNP